MQTGPSGVKGGNKPQSTPHPSCTHKYNMSADLALLPCSLPPSLLTFPSPSLLSLLFHPCSLVDLKNYPGSKSKLINQVNCTSLEPSQEL